MAVVIGFTLNGAVELEHGVDADFPDSLRDGSPLGADSDFALVFVAAQFALDGDVSALNEGAGEVSQFPEGDASMPLGPRFPRSGVILSGRFGGERKHRDVRCVADLLFGIAAEETDKSDSVEVHTFLPVCLGHSEASGRGSQDQKLLFWGHRYGGARTGTVPEAKQKLRRRRAPQEPRSSAETEGGTGNGPETVTNMIGRSR